VARVPSAQWHRVGSVADFVEHARRFVTVGSTEIGVLRHDGSFYAFVNRCPHQDGPVCEGMVFDVITRL
jgi:3-phenylpropionate/trans-cinnamate dioxygenase ferredoxin subunit